MLRRLVSVVSTLCLLLGATLPARAQDEFTLRYKFEKGKTFRFIDTINVKSSQEMMGQEMKVTSAANATTRLTVTDLRDDGAVVLTVAPEAMTVTVHSQQMDTTLTPKEMIGKRSRVTVSPIGLVSRREVIDTVRFTGIMRQVGQRELVRFHVFPDGPVKLGGTWKSVRPDTSANMGANIVTISTIDYSVIGWDKRDGKQTLKITYKGKVTVAGKGSMMGSDFFIEGTGTTGGIMYLDPASGMSLVEDSTLDMESTVALTGQQKMTIPSSTSMTTHHVFAAD